MSPLLDLTPLQLWLAAGRFLLMVSGTLLGMKHLAWLIRRDTNRYSYWLQTRHVVEMLSGFVIGIVYARQVFTRPQGVVLSMDDTVILVWAFAVLLSVLVVSKYDAH